MMKTYKVLLGALGGLMLMGSTAHADSLYIDPTGNVGIGTNTPGRPLHVWRDGAGAERQLLNLQNANGKARFLIQAGPVTWTFDNAGPTFDISLAGTGVAEFKVDGSGNGFFLGDVTANGVVLTSDRNVKQDFTTIDTQEILSKVVSLPISSWAFKKTPDVRHIGPMSQDFNAAFDVGNSDKTISMLDASGIAFAAIQALNDKIAALEAQLEEQKMVQARLEALEAVAVKLMQEREATLRPAALTK